MNQPEIESERLLLRAFTPLDAKDVQKLAGNKKVSEMTLNIPHPYEDGMAEEWISTHCSNWENRKIITYAVSDRISKKLLGTVGFVRIEESKAELGYWIGKQYWGRGYCTEAATALIKFACINLSVVTISAEHLSSNPASGRVMEKLGMHYVGSKYRLDRDGKQAKMKVYELQIT
ncbi:MAG: GNAT family N-acetyltransferase [Gammaproteobacteria bacterium]|nr:GNAT family N-acetyltransferase [Gammaproteobacteria bacterium]MCF6362739.1 GNAT family N-acetyltransferase [Gammaproteobacteria bacterium]